MLRNRTLYTYLKEISVSQIDKYATKDKEGEVKLLFSETEKILGYTFMPMNMSYKFKVVRKITLSFTFYHWIISEYKWALKWQRREKIRDKS